MYEPLAPGARRRGTGAAAQGHGVGTRTQTLVARAGARGDESGGRRGGKRGTEEEARLLRSAASSPGCRQSLRCALGPACCHAGLPRPARGCSPASSAHERYRRRLPGLHFSPRARSLAKPGRVFFPLEVTMAQTARTLIAAGLVVDLSPHRPTCCTNMQPCSPLRGTEQVQSLAKLS